MLKTNQQSRLTRQSKQHLYKMAAGLFEWPVVLDCRHRELRGKPYFSLKTLLDRFGAVAMTSCQATPDFR